METAKCKRVCERCVNEAMNSVKYKNRTEQFIDWSVTDLKKNKQTLFIGVLNVFTDFVLSSNILIFKGLDALN